jgi:hypothetical protein
MLVLINGADYGAVKIFENTKQSEMDGFPPGWSKSLTSMALPQAIVL